MRLIREIFIIHNSIRNYYWTLKKTLKAILFIAYVKRQDLAEGGYQECRGEYRGCKAPEPRNFINLR